jgi:hypothetical protein
MWARVFHLFFLSLAAIYGEPCRRLASEALPLDLPPP